MGSSIHRLISDGLKNNNLPMKIEVFVLTSFLAFPSEQNILVWGLSQSFGENLSIVAVSLMITVALEGKLYHNNPVFPANRYMTVSLLHSGI